MASGTSSSSSRHPADRDPPRGGDAGPGHGVPVPSHRALEALLDRHADFGPAPLSPEIHVFRARGLTDVWEAAERLAGRPVPPPFWAYPWPGGAALARVILDAPERVAGRRVLDIGTGGGVAALAAARAGASEVVANDLDAWALATARLAADRQRLPLTPLLGDLTAAGDDRHGIDVSGVDLSGFDVVLCGDMAYERRGSPRIRATLERAATAGAAVLVSDAGRAYFRAAGLVPIAEFTIAVPKDLEGVTERTARVFEMEAS